MCRVITDAESLPLQPLSLPKGTPQAPGRHAATSPNLLRRQQIFDAHATRGATSTVFGEHE